MSPRIAECLTHTLTPSLPFSLFLPRRPLFNWKGIAIMCALSPSVIHLRLLLRWVYCTVQCTVALAWKINQSSWPIDWPLLDFETRQKRSSADFPQPMPFHKPANTFIIHHYTCDQHDGTPLSGIASNRTKSSIHQSQSTRSSHRKHFTCSGARQLVIRQPLVASS